MAWLWAESSFFSLCRVQTVSSKNGNGKKGGDWDDRRRREREMRIKLLSQQKISPFYCQRRRQKGKGGTNVPAIRMGACLLGGKSCFAKMEELSLHTRHAKILAAHPEMCVCYSERVRVSLLQPAKNRLHLKGCRDPGGGGKGPP